MAKINLLPWREELRKQKMKEFGTLIGAFVLLGAIIVVMVHVYYSGVIEYHQSRNKDITEWSKKLDQQIKEIEELEREKQRLLDRMLAINQLQSNRPLIVRFFDELIASLPEGVSVNNIVQSGNNVTITGEAQSYARVASFMRDLEASDWLASPKLDVIQGTDAAGMRISTFTLRFNQVIPTTEEEGEGA
jgi:type IV pilus assembly protein PilN